MQGDVPGEAVCVALSVTALLFVPVPGQDLPWRHLLLVRADFPRQKKNQLPKDQVKRNEALADKYNAEGKFPFTLLVDENGKVLKTWDGFPNETPDQFVWDISNIIDSR